VATVTPSLNSYLTGMAQLVCMLAALGFGGYWLRRWMAPSYTGAPARLAEIVLALSLLIVTLQLIGSFGLLRGGWMVASCVGAGLGAAGVGRLRAPRSAEAARPPAVPTWALALAAIVAAVAVGEWAFPAQLDLGRGIFSGDSTWYHLPFSARFAQSHSTWNLLFTDPLALTAWFYPASSELLGSVGIILFKSDWLSPLINIGWLAIGLLAAYCIGRPFGVGPATLVAAAIALDSGVLLLTQAGEARNDAMGIALVVAFAALLLSGYRAGGRGPLALAGLAGGLAISVKLTMLAPFAAATLVALLAIALEKRRDRLSRAAALLGAELLTGGYWYLRNLAHSGNPIPQVHSIGPISLPHPDQMQLYPRGPVSVAHYLFDLHVYRVWFLPKLREALGLPYPLILTMALAAAIWAIVRLRDPILKALGIAAIVTAAVYVVTPLTAAGPPGEPHGFLTNTRYLMPGVALALSLLPLAGPLRSSPWRRAGTLAFLSVVFAVMVATTGRWEARFVAGAVFVALALVVAPAAAGWLRSARGLSRPLAIGLAVSLLVPALALGHAQETRYAQRHYTIRTLRAQEHDGPDRIFAWARNLHDQRIALAGGGGLFFDQGLFVGDDSSNWVQYIGESGPHGAYLVAPSCTAFRTLVDRGHYTYLVITEFGDNSPDRTHFPLHEWVGSDPALKRVMTEHAFPQTVYAYRVLGSLDPRACR
jgi:hypothetical protein